MERAFFLRRAEKYLLVEKIGESVYNFVITFVLTFDKLKKGLAGDEILLRNGSYWR